MVLNVFLIIMERESSTPKTLFHHQRTKKKISWRYKMEKQGYGLFYVVWEHQILYNAVKWKINAKILELVLAWIFKLWIIWLCFSKLLWCNNHLKHCSFLLESVFLVCASCSLPIPLEGLYTRVLCVSYT